MAVIELGLDTFGDQTRDHAGHEVSHAQVIRNVIAEGVLADSVGLDFFGIGEHHREDFSISAPEVVLAAIAGQTKSIHLGSAVTVLSSDDPIRVFQRFSSLDAASNGRAEVILGRGSFTESFPLFGFKLSEYETLFEEKLDLFTKIRIQEPVTWSGTTRSSLSNQAIYPTVEGKFLKTWIGVGGSPQSVVRAAFHDLPLMLAIIGGNPSRFRQFTDLYRRVYEQKDMAPQAIGIHSPGYVAETDERAREEFWPKYKVMRDRIGRERGWPEMERREFDQEVDGGSLYVGSPRTVATKIVSTLSALGASRFDLKYSAGPLEHEKLLRCIDLYGREVKPLVQAALGHTT